MPRRRQRFAMFIWPTIRRGWPLIESPGRLLRQWIKGRPCFPCATGGLDDANPMLIGAISFEVAAVSERVICISKRGSRRIDLAVRAGSSADDAVADDDLPAAQGLAFVTRCSQ